MWGEILKLIFEDDDWI